MEQTLRVPVQPLMAEFEKGLMTPLIAGCGEIRKVHRQHIPHRHTFYAL
jgi:hypothetical protein